MASEKLRAGKIGIAYEVEQKLEQNYDREEAAGTPTHVINWINEIVGGDHEKIGDPDWKAFNTHIRDGVMLCKLLNKLRTSAGLSPVQFQKKVMSPFVAMTNIENFNKGCVEYGLAQESTFQSGDLWEVRKAGLFNVLNCLSNLGFVANDKGCGVTYQGSCSKSIDRE